MKEVIIDNFKINKDSNTFIIAEIGTNHNQDKEKAKKLIDAAANAKVNAVKFQIYHPLDIVSPQILTSQYGLDHLYKEKYWYEVLENHLKTPVEWFPELADYSRQKGLKVIATVHCKECADKMVNYIDAFKVASMDLTHIPLLKELSLYNLPLIISCGMANMSEIDDAVREIKKNTHQLAILHCVSNYPTAYEELDLNKIKLLSNIYSYPIGFSDHSQEVLSSAIAVSVGAKIIEKHITLDKKDKGPDHPFALEPDELSSLVDSIRKTELSLSNNFGTNDKRDYDKRSLYRRSILAKVNIKKGEKITLDKICYARPGSGIQPKFTDIIIGRTAKVDISEGDTITWNSI